MNNKNSTVVQPYIPKKKVVFDQVPTVHLYVVTLTCEQLDATY